MKLRILRSGRGDVNDRPAFGVKTFRLFESARLSWNGSRVIIGLSGGTGRRRLLDMAEKPQLP